MEYRVVWEIDIEADSPEAAVELAMEAQRDPDSLAHVFTVTGPDGVTVIVDADEEDESESPEVEGLGGA